MNKMKILMMSVFSVAFMFFPIIIATPIQNFVYDWAPLRWYVDIQGVSAIQEDNEVVVHTLTRTVYKELRGKYQRTLFCAENETEYAIFIASGDITFDKKPTDKSIVRYSIDERFEGCNVFFFESIYYLVMPNGTERKYDTMKTQNFTVIHSGVYKKNNPAIPFAAPAKSSNSKNNSSNIEKSNTPSKNENNTTLINNSHETKDSSSTEEKKESEPVKKTIEEVIDNLKNIKLPL